MQVTEKAKKLVAVTLTSVGEDGSSINEEKEIPKGETEVLVIKAELGIAPELALWLIGKKERKHQLADHQSHDVKKGDHFQVIVPGGVS